ncbi:MAG: DUF4340 domain-containing protein [Bdellovibrionales bacterium]|nr:DUF4340 domain-containing protein [Bdellovibrionales bacterium]
MATKSPSWSKTLALAVTLIVLSTVAYWYEFRKKPDNNKQIEQQKKLFILTETQVRQVRIFQGANYFAFGCLDLASKTCTAGSNSRWELTAPVKLRADDGNVHSLLSAMNQLLPADALDLSGETTEERKRLLGQYGLSEEQQKSAQKIEVEFENGTSSGLIFGDVHPMGESQFAMVIHSSTEKNVSLVEKVYLIPKSFRSSISRPLTYWRDKKILTLQSHEIDSIAYQAKSSTFQAMKKDGNWTLITPLSAGSALQAPGDIENIDNWIAAIVYLSAKEFAFEKKNSPEGKKLLNSALSLVKLTLSHAGSPSVTLELFERKTKDSVKLLLTASNLDPIFELDPGAQNRLKKSVNDLRLTRLLGSLDRFNAAEITLRSKTLSPQEIIFEKKAEQWIRKTSPGPDDASRISSLLEQLSGNRVKAFLPESKPKKDATTLTITLKDGNSKTLRSLEFWRDGERLLGRDLLLKRNETLEIDPSLISSLPWEKI